MFSPPWERTFTSNPRIKYKIMSLEDVDRLQRMNTGNRPPTTFERIMFGVAGGASYGILFSLLLLVLYSKFIGNLYLTTILLIVVFAIVFCAVLFAVFYDKLKWLLFFLPTFDG